MIEKLKAIVKHNEKELDKVEGDQNQAENLYTLGYEEFSIWNFFYDETLREEVNPIEYYGKDKLNKVINEYEEDMA